MDITVATTLGFARRPSACQLSAITASNWSPSTDAPALVDDEYAVGIAIQRDADVGAHLLHLAGKIAAGSGRAAFVVDIEAVRLDAERDHLGVELPQRRHGAAR